MSRAKAKRPAKVADASLLRERIEEQRRQLNKAVAVLIGAELSAEYCPDISLVTDAIGVVRELVEHVIDALDSVALTRADAR